MHGQLDRERATRYQLKIVATDGKFSDVQTVKVIITDDNDNPPQCTQVSAPATSSTLGRIGSPITGPFVLTQELQYLYILI